MLIIESKAAVLERLIEIGECLASVNFDAYMGKTLCAPSEIVELSEPGIGLLYCRFAARAEPELPCKPMPLEGRYFDDDNHVVFIGGYITSSGELREMEIERLDLKPIGALPNCCDITFEARKPGSYKTIQG
jgi:hypothetical protein